VFQKLLLMSMAVMLNLLSVSMSKNTLPSLERGHRVLVASDGVPIHYVVQGKGEPALVFVHCWGCDRNLWENQVSEFARRHRVVVIDLPGHGESGQGRKNWSMESYGEDVERIVATLNLKRVVLIGSSMGGPVILEAARRMPDQVVGLVPVDTFLNVDQRLSPDAQAGVIKRLESDYKGTTTKTMSEMSFGAGTSAAVKDRVIKAATSRPPEVAIPILKATFEYNPIPALRETKIPIRAINGGRHPTNLEANRKYAPQFEAVIMKDAGHYPMLEDPAQFNRLLDEFLRKLPPGNN
jgi:sigma-B regulation protein RsbQ